MSIRQGMLGVKNKLTMIWLVLIRWKVDLANNKKIAGWYTNCIKRHKRLTHIIVGYTIYLDFLGILWQSR